jgi:peptide methionine sulfoxide reductase msrA/msrB
MQRIVACVSLLTALLGACSSTRSVETSAAHASTTPQPPAKDGVMSSSNPKDDSAPRLSARTYAPMPAAELAQRLTPLQFKVTQEAATEPPFRNTFFDNHEAGLYVDVATGEPLFSSRDKFESGTGWPSFTRPVESGRVIEHEDLTYGMVRTEVVSAGGHSHLGHVFPDGPEPTGLRYCINSAALRFIPAARLAAEGYGDYVGAVSGSGGALHVFGTR